MENYVPPKRITALGQLAGKETRRAGSPIASSAAGRALVSRGRTPQGEEQKHQNVRQACLIPGEFSSVVCTG